VSGANGAGNGASDEDDAEALEPVLGEIPGPILELAESCRRFALGAVGVALDYDAETLPILDEYLRVAAQGIGDRPELEEVVTGAAAAYFGEVVRRRIDGFWRHRPDDPSDEWELCAKRALLSFSPRGVVLESLAKSSEQPGPSGELRLAPDDARLAEQRLAIFPPVSEDEYYLLSTRLEVIETVYESLRDRLKSEGRESLVFDESDYEDE
jgi:hypothetical protein